MSLGEIAGRKAPYRKWLVYRGGRKQRSENGVEVWLVLEARAALR